MAEEKDFLNDEAFWKELGLDLSDVSDGEPKQEISAAGEPPVRKKAAPEKKKSASDKKKEPRKAEAGSGKKAKKNPNVFVRIFGTMAASFSKTIVALACAALTVALLVFLVMISAGQAGGSSGSASGVTIMDKFDMFMTNQISNALEGIVTIPRVYWLSDSDMVAPKPDPANYGTASSPAGLMWLKETCADLIGDQELIFNENTPAWETKDILYYYDETILVITWKQVIDRVVYNMSEIRVAHPSQFRRFLAGGEFGSDKQYTTTEMAQSVNAVVAFSGDFYKYRRNGAVVYEGQLRRFEGKYVDSCFINEDGNLLFAYRGELTSEEEAIRFVEDNKVRFSLAFGPVLVDDGVACPPANYPLGEPNDHYARAALCQVDELHYLLVSACGEQGYQNRHTIADFARNLQSFGVDKAYALDGGQTTVLAMDGKLINDVEFGYQRKISDIIYFATALPDGE